MTPTEKLYTCSGEMMAIAQAIDCQNLGWECSPSGIEANLGIIQENAQK